MQKADCELPFIGTGEDRFGQRGRGSDLDWRKAELGDFRPVFSLVESWLGLDPGASHCFLLAWLLDSCSLASIYWT